MKQDEENLTMKCKNENAIAKNELCLEVCYEIGFFSMHPTCIGKLNLLSEHSQIRLLQGHIRGSI